MGRLDVERQKELEPSRIEYAYKAIQKAGYDAEIIGKSVRFEYLGENIIFWPYSGWATGKTIEDCRGLKNLLKQIEQ